MGIGATPVARVLSPPSDRQHRSSVLGHHAAVASDLVAVAGAFRWILGASYAGKAGRGSEMAATRVPPPSAGLPSCHAHLSMI
jgi:hypothetical protein